ncbi:hypothetical protein PF010_g16264 [Phytophthora fragariae]|uniref:Uncharacterized protein n=1 Tax=Phytophthora fragariae TaxID=53985 RepID=A0A6G0KSA2_9STRA|nr:hypothetical protein PF003_g37030 [Phytophthora fragariae]KAE9096667.1 hypothetical protein PF010_g16264 [Phytophthora fragariae]
MWTASRDSRAVTAVTATAVTTTGAVNTCTGGTGRRVKSAEAAVTSTRPLTRAAKRRSDEQRRRDEERASAAAAGGDMVADAGSVLAALHDVTAPDGVPAKAPDAIWASRR